MNRKLSAALVLAVSMAAGCSQEAVEPPVAEPRVENGTITFPDPNTAPRLTTATIGAEPAAKVKLNGRVTWDEDRTVRVYSPFAGKVARILVQPGDSVRQGQALAVLGSAEFGQVQTEARRAETDVALAEKNLQRVKELEAAGVAPRKDLQVSEAEYERAKAELDRARGRMRMYGGGAKRFDQAYAVASPIAGVVVERNINPGQELRPDQMGPGSPPLFVVTNPARLWVLLDASENDLAAAAVGKTVTVSSPVYPNEQFIAKIKSVSDFLDPATRTLKVRATLDNGNRRLKAEMFVTGEIDGQRTTRMRVPAKAVFFQGGQHYLFTEEGPGRYKRQEVRVDDEIDGKVEIVGGVRIGERVVVDDVLMLQQTLQPRRVQK